MWTFSSLKTAAAETVTAFSGGLMGYGVLKASRLRSCMAEVALLPSIVGVKSEARW